MDRLSRAISPAAKIRFAFADVTVAAKALEARHLSGPTASLALAEGLVATALLSQDAAREDEAVMLRLNCAGPLRGVMVEAMGDGGLRGFTNVKILNDLDDRDSLSTEDALGRSGSVQILTSVPGKIRNQASINVSPPLMKYILARYFNHSMQVPTACEVYTRADSAGMLVARGLIAQRMEDSDPEAFVRVLERFEDGEVVRALAKSGDCRDFGDVLELPDIAVREERPLMFKCRCTRERTLAVLKTLSRGELEALVNKGQRQQIICHMCGESYFATVPELQAILEASDGE